MERATNTLPVTAAAPQGRAASPAAKKHTEMMETAAQLPKCHESPAWPNIFGMARLCIGWFLIFCAFLTTQNLLPMFLEQAGFGKLGFYSLMVLYVFFAAACVPTPMLLKSVSPRKALPCGAFMYVLYVACVPLVISGVIPAMLSKTVFLCASALAGIGAAVSWCCQGHIVTHYATQEVLNTYLSFFFVCFSLTSAVGSKLAHALVDTVSVSGIFTVLSVLCICGDLLLVELPAPNPTAKTPKEAALDSRSVAQKIPEIRANLAKPFKLLQSNSSALCIGIISFIHGIGINCFGPTVLARFVLLQWHGDVGRAYVAKVMMYLGLGNTSAAILFAPFSNRFGRRIALGSVAVNLAMVACTCFLEMKTKGRPFEGGFVCIAALFTGMANIGCRATVSALISSFFKNESVQMVALMQMSSSCGVVLGFLVLPELSVFIGFVVVLVGYIAATVMCICHNPFFASVDRAAEKKDR